MFDEAYRILFFSTPAKLKHKNNNLIVQTQINEEVQIPLRDISTIVIDTPQISLNSSLLSTFATYKIMLFVCDDSHMPSGFFSPFLAHYRSARVLQAQIGFKQQNKSILWQQIIKQKIYNQTQVLLLQNHLKVAHKLQILQKSVRLNDSSNHEAKSAMLYFPALFGKGFARKQFCVINSALNYGYAILRGVIARNLVASGLLPSLGIFHHNQFNPFNLADDLIETFRPFVDFRVVQMDLDQNLELKDRVYLVEILHTKVLIGDKHYPLYRAITQMVQSFARSLQTEKGLTLPILTKECNGREIHESVSDV